MGNKSNKWVRRMAERHCMIEPLEPEGKGYTTIALSQTTPPLGSICPNEDVARVGTTWSTV
jgi:hypothetical protein